jgi:hypothetical protein
LSTTIRPSGDIVIPAAGTHDRPGQLTQAAGVDNCDAVRFGLRGEQGIGSLDELVGLDLARGYGARRCVRKA